jgi:hypothetical protein
MHFIESKKNVEKGGILIYKNMPPVEFREHIAS